MKMVGMVNVEPTSSNYLTAVIKDILIHCILPLHPCRGEAHDGAANAVGHPTGVAATDE